MAKTTNAITTAQGALFDIQIFRRYGPPASELVRQASTVSANLAAARTAGQQRMTQIHAAWTQLSTWKKIRWTLCALRHMAPIPTGPTAKYYNGYALYASMSHSQNVIVPKEPISPCARRLTDPGASPHDYTP